MVNIVLVGRQGCGKSTVIAALFLILSGHDIAPRLLCAAATEAPLHWTILVKKKEDDRDDNDAYVEFEHIPDKETIRAVDTVQNRRRANQNDKYEVETY
ncbi:hypothetical protein CCACVL1_25388 [Corchorus capsularis]|uniref:Uncharacterized protein n=1 Tax=Corchorus capsularis TaxID=210143 RepID=A0A1R3GKY2_COCAP|nr:hypothetical protein CCACVL1_25388 [Corchorus capsularis]